MDTNTPKIIIKSHKTLTLKKNTSIGVEQKLNQELLIAHKASSVPTKSFHKKNISEETSAKIYDFNAIYKELHNKFPATINLNSPVLLAVGIKQILREITGISGVILKKWIAWYCNRSKYYELHKVGATRFNLDGTEAGIVTEEHQERRNKYLEQMKKLQKQ